MISKNLQAGVMYENKQILKAIRGRIFKRTCSDEVIGSMIGLDQKGMFQTLYYLVPNIENETDRASKGFLGNTSNKNVDSILLIWITT